MNRLRTFPSRKAARARGSGHWTTFDLTRHGMVVSGHATQGLPQVVLELDGDDIVAFGVLGLIFGYGNNLVHKN